MKPFFSALVMLGALLICVHFNAQGQTTPPKLSTRLVVAKNQARPGELIMASLIVDIPSGYHLNAHDPISRFALPTKIEVLLPEGYRVGTISYPRAIVRKFSFTTERLGVYEKQAVIRFSLRIPPNEQQRTTTVKTVLNYQSCSDQVCFPPNKQEATAVFKVGRRT